MIMHPNLVLDKGMWVYLILYDGRRIRGCITFLDGDYLGVNGEAYSMDEISFIGECI